MPTQLQAIIGPETSCKIVDRKTKELVAVVLHGVASSDDQTADAHSDGCYNQAQRLNEASFFSFLRFFPLTSSPSSTSVHLFSWQSNIVITLTSPR